MSTLLSLNDSKLRAVLTFILLIVGIIGTIVLDDDMHQMFAAMGAIVSILVQLAYWSSDYDAPF